MNGIGLSPFSFVPDPRAATIDAPENLDVVVTPPSPESLTPRPPVVAIMGHIDHGKTTLLDHLRHSRVVDGEFGGITQHIGAFSVRLDGGDAGEICFVDTPGHAAFKQMRSRGAGATDVVVLVVDASEGVLDQTKESIRMVKEAGAAMIVAINKIDRPSADVAATKLGLRDAGVELEEFGGDVPAVAISALLGTNVPELVEALLATAEMLQLSADRDGPVEGVVLESTADGGLGKVATMLVQRGRLKKGDLLVCGLTHAKVRKLMDDRGREQAEAGPSQAVRVMGWKEVPPAGEAVHQVDTERRAKEVVGWRHAENQRLKAAAAAGGIEKEREAHRQDHLQYRMTKLSLGLFHLKYGRHDFHVRQKESKAEDGTPKVSVVVKADVDGSLEAILDCLDTYAEEEVKLDIIDFGVGDVKGDGPGHGAAVRRRRLRLQRQRAGGQPADGRGAGRRRQGAQHHLQAGRRPQGRAERPHAGGRDGRGGGARARRPGVPHQRGQAEGARGRLPGLLRPAGARPQRARPPRQGQRHLRRRAGQPEAPQGRGGGRRPGQGVRPPPGRRLRPLPGGRRDPRLLRAEGQAGHAVGAAGILVGCVIRSTYMLLHMFSRARKSKCILLRRRRLPLWSWLSFG